MPKATFPQHNQMHSWHSRRWQKRTSFKVLKISLQDAIELALMELYTLSIQPFTFG
jgi:hypothetical protein